MLPCILLWSCYQKVCMGGPATRHSKASKQARLAEKKVCFISDAGNSVWGGWQTSVQRPNPPLLRRGESIYRQSQQGRGGRGQHAETAVTCNSHLQIGHQWTASIILVVLGTVNLQLQGAFVPISLWSILRIVAAQVLGTSLVIM